jgi:hypothetical protein
MRAPPAAGPMAMLLLGLAACARPEPVAYAGVASAAQLAPNPRDDSGRIPFRYATQADWRAYGSVIVDPVTIYRGADAQFGDLSEADKAELAAYMQTRFEEALQRRRANVAAPGTLRLRLTLTGATASTPVLSTLTRFDIGGGVINGVQAVRGGQGLFTGDVSYVVELLDAASGRLLEAQVTRQYPNAYNIPATFGALAAARAGIDKGATALAAQLR